MGRRRRSCSFFEQLEERCKQAETFLCVGLDPHEAEVLKNEPDKESLSEEERCDAAYSFCRTIIDATAPYAAAYKPNAAFFEALGCKLGMSTLQRVIESVPDEIPVLLDVKRGDIGSTAAAYADACFGDLHADGVTLSPLMGWDSVEPFVTGKYSDRGAFLLCKTSNPGSNDLLALQVTSSSSSSSSNTLYENIAQLACRWSSKLPSPMLGLVVGATDPSALARVRSAAGPNIWILAPGVGAQGGNLEQACHAGFNANGTGMLIPVSRGISQAPDGPAQAAKRLTTQINQVVQQIKAQTPSNSSTTTDLASYQSQFLRLCLSEGVLKFGSFVLKSGRTSPYFFNAGLFASGSALSKLGYAYASSIMASNRLASIDGKAQFDVVFGPAYKGIPLGAIVCASLYEHYGVDVGFAYNRKEAKDHGEGGSLVGASMEHKRVLIVDDVITAGTAIREACSMLKEHVDGATPIGVAIALDRAEKRSLDDDTSAVQAVERDLDMPVVSIVSLPQLEIFLRKNPKDYSEDVLKRVLDYRVQYGV